jgi:dipeptidyl aminopeptidase/acylaminoacyl peptidase
MIGRILRLLAGGLLLMATAPIDADERQITRDSAHDHWLDNNDNFSPDDRYLVFDTRTAAGIHESTLIAKVEITTGKITPLYRAQHPGKFGPGVAAASYAHNRNEVIFIHGPLQPTGPDNQYEKHRRVGCIVSGDGTGIWRFADARNTKPPYTVGALRGGTHRHEFSGDGKWIGFTYNDAVVRAQGLKIGKNLDLRTIGVTKLGRSVRVPAAGQFSTQSDGFSALVVVVTPDPKPGSDEISHAASDSWVGLDGYKRADAGRQLARAFIGTTRDAHGQAVDELFVVDIPQDISIPGALGSLEGTETTFPMPPAGTVQRRLTQTENAQYPGCQGIARSSPDGARISFRLRDHKGQWQIFLIAPQGGQPQQATFVDGGVDTDARWHPSGHAITCVTGNRILVTDVRPGPRFGHSTVLGDRPTAPCALVWSHDGKTLAYNRIVKTDGKDVVQIFVTNDTAGDE